MPPLRPAVAVPLWVGVEGETVTSNELVERLHRWTRNGYVMDLNLDKDLEEAADEIERLRYEIMAKDTEWQLQEQLKDKALAELDNERSAMRNVQECAESYRRERDGLKEMNAHLSRGNATLSVAEHKLTAENERLRADLEHCREYHSCNYCDAATREALRPADETPHRIDKLGDCRNPGCVYPAVGYTDRSKCPIGPAFETGESQ